MSGGETPDYGGFIRRNTVLASPPLVPEIRLHMATEVTPLWQASEAFLQQEQLPPPFWAFAWPGGQALARLILDRPDIVAGAAVLDLGSGSGLLAVAAMLAGAGSAVAVDLDPVACAAIALNAASNGVVVRTAERDACAWADPPVELIVAGDVCYERSVAGRIADWMRRQRARGITVLLGDPGRMYLPKSGLEPLGAYCVPTSLDLEDRTERETVVYRLV